jgi:6-hydroxytryprostatin B O-methyltransferase
MEILRWMSHFKIFELVPLDGKISYSELASKAGVTEERLKSLARMAMTSSLFTEPERGYMAHSITSAALVTNQGLASFRRWITAVTGAAFDTDLGMYEYIATKPEIYRLFDSAMQAVAKSPMSHLKHLISGFDWASLGKATVVDVSHLVFKTVEIFSSLLFLRLAEMSATVV